MGRSDHGGRRIGSDDDDHRYARAAYRKALNNTISWLQPGRTAGLADWRTGLRHSRHYSRQRCTQQALPAQAYAILVPRPATLLTSFVSRRLEIRLPVSGPSFRSGCHYLRDVVAVILIEAK